MSKSRISGIVVVSLMTLGLGANPAMAAGDSSITVGDSTCDFTAAGLGAGSATHPYRIGTAKQLAEVNDCYSNGYKYFSMVANINLANSTALWNNTSAEGWVPIGTDNIRFTGTFDGQGHTVTGLKIHRSQNHQGIFGSAERAVFKNFSITGTVTTSESNQYVGGLVGYAERSSISHINTSVNVTGSGSLGTISGGCNYGNISNIHSSGDVTALGSTGYIGGISGQNNYTNIDQVFATGDVVADNQSNGEWHQVQYVGGVAGFFAGGTIANSSYTGNLVGSRYVGGILGYGYVGMLDHNAFSGTISASHGTNNRLNASYLGGIAGYWEEGAISNSRVSGSISVANNSSDGSEISEYIGGLVGHLDYGVATQADVSIDLTVNSTKSTQSSKIGGIAGAVTSTGVSDVYYRGKLVVNDVARVGGIVGDAENGVSVIRSDNLGSMKIESASSSTLGQIGGVIGYGANGVLVKGTSNESNVVTSGAFSTNVGGIIGYAEDGVMIENSYNRGNVSGQNVVAGIVGFSNTRSLEIANTYNTGRTSARLASHPKVDAIVAEGWEESATSRTNTFDMQTTGASRSATGAVGKSTKAMKSQSSFVDLGWSIGAAGSLWAIAPGTNDGYPFIKPVAAVSITVSAVRDLYGPVSFKQGSSKLTKSSKAKLLTFVAAIKAGGYSTVTVKSYTTSTHTYLAGKRNDAVVKFLKSHGVTVKMYKEAVTRSSQKKKNKIWLVAIKKS